MNISHILCMIFGAGCLYAWQAYRAYKDAAGVETSPGVAAKEAPDKPDGRGNPGPIDPQ